MLYSLPYLILVIFFGGFAMYVESEKSLEDENRKRINFACLGILIFFFGFRGYICDDWIVYHQMFDRISFDVIKPTLVNLDVEWPYESGFSLLMWVCKSIYNNYSFFVFVCTLINTFLLFNFFKNRIENIPFAIVLYLCFGGFGFNTNMMRNSIAILIFINALKYIEERKAIHYYALCILAISCHLSALIYLPLYFFFHKRCPKWLFAAIFLMGNTIYLLHIPIVMGIMKIILGGVAGKIEAMIELYSEEGFGGLSSTISIGYIERLITSVLIFCYYDKLIEIREENKVFINAFIGYFIMFFYLNEFTVMALRMSNLFIFAYWIIWIDLLKCFSINNNRRLFIAFMTIYCLFKMIGMTSFVTCRYDNVLWGIQSYEERLYIHQKLVGQ